MKRVIAKGKGQVLEKLEFAFPGNIRPRAFNGKMTTTLNTPTMINPSMLAFDANGDPRAPLEAGEERRSKSRLWGTPRPLASQSMGSSIG